MLLPAPRFSLLSRVITMHRAGTSDTDQLMSGYHYRWYSRNMVVTQAAFRSGSPGGRVRLDRSQHREPWSTPPSTRPRRMGTDDGIGSVGLSNLKFV